MKNIAFAFLLFLIYTSGFAQTIAVKDDKPGIRPADSIDVFYKALFKAFKAGYIHRKTVDWKTVEAETYRKLKNYSSFKASLAEVTDLFDRLNATHCLVYRGMTSTP